jgi:hypothetical protein
MHTRRPDVPTDTPRTDERSVESTQTVWAPTHVATGHPQAPLPALTAHTRSPGGRRWWIVSSWQRHCNAKIRGSDASRRRCNAERLLCITFSRHAIFCKQTTAVRARIGVAMYICRTATGNLLIMRITPWMTHGCSTASVYGLDG